MEMRKETRLDVAANRPWGMLPITRADKRGDIFPTRYDSLADKLTIT